MIITLNRAEVADFFTVTSMSHGGGEGSRTPVRRQRHAGFYGCSHGFDVTRRPPHPLLFI